MDQPLLTGLMLAALLAGHFTADTFLQPPWLSAMKYNEVLWFRLQALGVHGAVHALPVALVTGSPLLAIAEMVAHPLIDTLKSRGWYGVWADQLLHVACKVLWLALLPHLPDALWAA